MDFLTTAIAKSRETSFSSLTDHVILSTIYGRCVTHRRLACSPAFVNTASNAFWARHNWLSDMIKNKSRKPEEISRGVNLPPSTLFSELLRQEIIIHLHDTAEIWPYHSSHQQMVVLEYRQTAIATTKEASQRIKLLARRSTLKVSLNQKSFFQPCVLLC